MLDLSCFLLTEKPPPGDVTWYTELVGSLEAVSRSAKHDSAPALGSTNPTARGLQLLKAARRVELKRLMRIFITGSRVQAAGEDALFDLGRIMNDLDRDGDGRIDLLEFGYAAAVMEERLVNARVVSEE